MNVYTDLLAVAIKVRPPFRGRVDFQRAALLETAYSMACSMLEGLLDPDPVIAEAARLIYVKRLADMGDLEDKKNKNAFPFGPDTSMG